MLRLAFAGDRDISVKVLKRISQDVQPLALLVSSPKKASHAKELKLLCDYLPPERILEGKRFREAEGIQLLRSLNLDFIIAVHFPYIVPPEVLSLPKHGVLNLHPAYLPYNRGWHTPSWAILEDTPIGATLHFMDEGIDTGDIVHQKRIKIRPEDTAHTLYQRVKELEYEVFEEAWPLLLRGTYQRIPQPRDKGTVHKRKDLFQPEIQKLELRSQMTVEEMIRRLRALTTNRIDEAAYFEVDGKHYRIQVHIFPES